MNALNPVQRVGDQIAEPMIERQGLSKAAAATRAGELLELVGIPRARGEGLPARAVRRHAPAGDDRDGPRLRSGGRHRRRADDGPRRHGPGPDPGAPGGPPGEARPVAHPHHPRPLGPRRDLRPGDDHVRGPGGGGGPGGDGLRGRRATRTPRCSWRPSPTSTSGRRDLGTIPGVAAGPAHAAARLPVPPPLPGRDGRLPDRGAARGDVRRPRPGRLPPLPAGQRRRPRPLPPPAHAEASGAAPVTPARRRSRAGTATADPSGEPA